MIKYRHKLSWSNTRITLLEYCEKKYYLNYYTTALRSDYPDFWKEAQILKRCKSLEMWMGEKTHYLISDYLNAIQSWNPVDVDTIKLHIAQEMREEFELSKNKDFSELKFDDFWWLSEHFYWENVDDRLEEVIGKVLNNLDQFILSEWWKKVIDFIKKKYLVYIEHPRFPDFDAMRIDLEWIASLSNVNIMASPDFWVVVWENEYLILDWKTGKDPFDSSALTDQLKVYALKLLLKATKGKTNLMNIKISAYEVYLPSLSVYGGEVKQEDIDDIVQKIRKDIDFQKKFLVNEDPLANEPLDSTVFSRTFQKQKCEHCTFRQVCDKLEKIGK